MSVADYFNSLASLETSPDSAPDVDQLRAAYENARERFHEEAEKRDLSPEGECRYWSAGQQLNLLRCALVELEGLLQ